MEAFLSELRSDLFAVRVERDGAYTRCFRDPHGYIVVVVAASDCCERDWPSPPVTSPHSADSSTFHTRTHLEAELRLGRVNLIAL
jgi:hypothetical protein